MSRGGIFSEAVAGGDRFCLDNFAINAGLVHETLLPGGDSICTWQSTLNMAAQHRAWGYGRNIFLGLGTDQIWHGHMDDPTRGTTWSMQAVGVGADGVRFVAFDASTGNALSLNNVVDNAIGRTPNPLGWTRPASLSTMASSAAIVQSGSISVQEALDQVAAAQTTETYWQVSTNGVLTMGAAPTTPSYILYATTAGGGRSLEGFVSDAFVMYQSASGQITVDQRSNTVARVSIGRFEQVVDETGLSLIPSSQADALGDAFLARNSARAKWGGTFTATFGQLTTMGGVPVDLATVRAGFLAAVIVTDPDSAGETALQAIPNVLFGQTSYDWDADVLTLTPVYTASDNNPALLGAGSGA